MNICEIIEWKKLGNKLSQAQIDWWIKGVVDASVADYQTSALLMACVLNGLDAHESYFLTTAMANSGHMVDMSALGDLTCDKHSSGGVGDSTTFLVLPIVVACGYVCAKASGRGLGHTGGTLDKLEAVQGLKIALTEENIRKQIRDIHIAIIGQTKEICPADKRIYAIRDVTATVESVGLIASSIMSKKLAGGSKNIVLDVKCGCGAFMKTLDDATCLAELMVDIGKKANRNISAIITNMDCPLSDYIGNALEVYGAIKALKCQEKGRLYDLSIALATRLLQIAGEENAEQKARNAIESGKAYEVFCQMLIAQGGDKDIVENEEKLLTAQFVDKVVAKENGYISEINALEIAKLVCELGGGRKKIDDKIDFAVGVKIEKYIGDKVEKGDILATIFYNKEVENQSKIVENSFGFSQNKTEKPQLIYKII
ncbi:MAG: thymidine phosphorylase [Clostridia bacterium]